MYEMPVLASETSCVSSSTVLGLLMFLRLARTPAAVREGTCKPTRAGTHRVWIHERSMVLLAQFFALAHNHEQLFHDGVWHTAAVTSKIVDNSAKNHCSQRSQPWMISVYELHSRVKHVELGRTFGAAASGKPGVSDGPGQALVRGGERREGGNTAIPGTNALVEFLSPPKLRWCKFFVDFISVTDDRAVVPLGRQQLSSSWFWGDREPWFIRASEAFDNTWRSKVRLKS